MKTIYLLCFIALLCACNNDKKSDITPTEPSGESDDQIKIGKYEVTNDVKVRNVEAYNYVALPIKLTDSKPIFGKIGVFKDESLSPNKDDNYNPIDYFFRSNSKDDITVSLNIDLSFEAYGRFAQPKESIDDNVVLAVYKFKDYRIISDFEVVGGPWVLDMSGYEKDNTWAWATFKGQINNAKFWTTMKENECLSFVWAFHNLYGAVEHGEFTFKEFQKFQVFIEEPDHERGSDAGTNYYCTVDSSGEFQTIFSVGSRIFYLDNRKDDGTTGKYKSVEYNGYLSGEACIVMLDYSLKVIDYIEAKEGSHIDKIDFLIPSNCRVVYFTCPYDHLDDYYLKIYLNKEK